jgi:SNF2 family DNA or RNA helicase
MLRRTKEEVGLNLPPIVHIDFEVELEGEQEKVYRQLEKDAAATIDGGRVLPLNVLSEMLRLKQLSGASWYIGTDKEMHACLPSVKFDAVLDLLSERGIDADWEPGGEKVTIGSQFVSILEMAQRELAALGVPAYLITGAPTEEHDEMVRSFQEEGGKPVLLMTLQKGTSIDLDRADTTILWDLLWNPDDNGQWVDRHQRSRPTPLTAIRLVAKNAVDGYIIEVNADKEDIQHRVLDGRRGIEFAKRILNRRQKGAG